MKTWETKSGYKIIQILSGRSNVFLLTNGEKNILVDTSPGYMWKLLVKRLNKLNIKSIDYLILTHTHADHSENAHSIKDKYKSLLFVHKEEASYLTSGDSFLPQGTTFITKIILNIGIKNIYAGFKNKPCQYDYLVDSEFDLKKFGFNAFILHTPGHSPGSMSVIIDNEIALVGDAMFGIFMGSVFPPFAYDVKLMVKSWGRLLETNCLVFLPSHGTANSRELVQKDFNKRIHVAT
jgi:hydroxyacylglutathione hydrolase